MLKSQGQCKISCVVNKDLFVPKEEIVIKAKFDNSTCQLAIEKYVIRLKRSIEVFKDKGKDVLFIKEDFTYIEEFDAECPKLDIEEKEFIIYVPEKL